MLTRILHKSPALCEFIEQLNLPLSQPPLRQVRHIADALRVCHSDKTLAELQRQFVACVDASNLADTLRRAPWTAQDLRQPVGAWLVREAVTCARQAGALDYLCVSLHDASARKHKHTRHLEPLDWHFDHVESTPYKPRPAKGLAYLGCHIWIGSWAVTFDVRRYLRDKTGRRINRQRPPAERVGFLSKNHLARHILQQLRPLVPPDLPV